MPAAERAFWRRLAAAVRLSPLGTDLVVDAHERSQPVCHPSAMSHRDTLPPFRRSKCDLFAAFF
jgi:hypothetical protein